LPSPAAGIAKESTPNPLDGVKQQPSELRLPKIVGAAQRGANRPAFAVPRPRNRHDSVGRPLYEQIRRVHAKAVDRGNAVQDERPHSLEHRMPASGIAKFDLGRRAIAFLKIVGRVGVESRPMADNLEPSAKDDCTIGGRKPFPFGGRQIDSLAPHVATVAEKSFERSQCRPIASIRA
jgi:hypothetical protein